MYAATCEESRTNIQKKVTVALRLDARAQCPALRDLESRTQRCATLASESAIIHGLIQSRCICPDNPAKLVQRCETVASNESSEGSLLACVYEMQKLEKCPGVKKPDYQKTIEQLKARYGKTATCENLQHNMDSLSRQANATKDCRGLGEISRRRDEFRNCPQITADALKPVSSAIERARARASDCSERDSTVSQLYAQLEKLNSRIKLIENCARNIECIELESERLLALTTYLELVVTRDPGELARALVLLRGIGTDPTLLEIVSKHGPEALQIAAAASDVFNSPELRKRFLAELNDSRFKNLAGVLARNDATFEEFLDAFLREDDKTKVRALSLADSLADSAQLFYETYVEHERYGRWEVWVDEASDNCLTCGTFTSEVLKYFKNAQLVHPKSSADFMRRAIDRNNSCRLERMSTSQPQQNPKSLSCGLLLRVQLTRSPPEIQPAGDLYYITGATDQVAHKPIRMAAFRQGEGEREAAHEFARIALITVSGFMPPGTPEPLPEVRPSPHCGVAVSYHPEFKPAPKDYTLQIEGACGDRSFVRNITDVLRSSGRLRSVSSVEHSTPAKVPRLRLNFETDSSGLQRCEGRILSSDEEELYVVKAVVDTAKSCAPEAVPSTRWAKAGEDIGILLRNYYAGPVNLTIEPSKRPDVRSSGWYSLAFAGLPYIQDSRATTWSKAVPSVLDAALLIGAGVSFGLSVKYRNDFAANRTDSLGPATAALNTGIVLGIVLLGNRVLSGFGYEYAENVWQRDK